MQMQKPTAQMIAEWKETWNQYRNKISPNKKSGKEIVNYLSDRYPLKTINDENTAQIVTRNILENEVLASKIPEGKKPLPITFLVEKEDSGVYLYDNQDDIFKGAEIFVGIDLFSGCFFVEGSSLLWDELCAFSGLDEEDIKNYYCVAKYISCLKKFDLLDKALN